jgi:hypothetical protein
MLIPDWASNRPHTGQMRNLGQKNPLLTPLDTVGARGGGCARRRVRSAPMTLRHPATSRLTTHWRKPVRLLLLQGKCKQELLSPEVPARCRGLCRLVHGPHVSREYGNFLGAYCASAARSRPRDELPKAIEISILAAGPRFRSRLTRSRPLSQPTWPRSKPPRLGRLLPKQLSRGEPSAPSLAWSLRPGLRRI